ncbi:hypothetical protein BDF14DRAFT_1858292 [Spinellus fusiger]|nr:hypothetical protein BDF14DRAFT_1858292 [Spinellus fusiger]
MSLEEAKYTHFPGVLDSAQYISEHSRHVYIPLENIDHAAKAILKSMETRSYSTKTWKEHILHPKSADCSTVDWIFLVDLLNFSFWSDLDTVDASSPHPDRYSVSYKDKAYTGYWSLCAAINKALDKGIPITNPSYYGYEATDQELIDIFHSDTREKVPLIEERIKVMREAGRVVCDLFGGSFVNCIEQANGSAQALLSIIVKNFNSFRDIHIFNGRSVSILKRAQILIADIWACFDDQSYGAFADIHTITMFADYRVPQALYYLGVLCYSPELMEKLKRREILASGSNEEIEIRGNSIWSVELICRRIQQLQPERPTSINAILLDFYIWDFAKENQDEMMVPTHCTRSCFY